MGPVAVPSGDVGVASHRQSASGQDLVRNVIQGDTENSKPIEGQGNFLLWKWEGGEEISFRAVEQKTSCLSWMSREQPGSFWPSWDGRAEKLGKHQIWKESNLHSSIAQANFLLFKMENQMKKTAKCSINVRNDSISLEKAPSHRNSWKGLPPWTETPSPL